MNKVWFNKHLSAFFFLLPFSTGSNTHSAFVVLTQLVFVASNVCIGTLKPVSPWTMKDLQVVWNQNPSDQEVIGLRPPETAMKSQWIQNINFFQTWAKSNGVCLCHLCWRQTRPGTDIHCTLEWHKQLPFQKIRWIFSSRYGCCSMGAVRLDVNVVLCCPGQRHAWTFSWPGLFMASCQERGANPSCLHWSIHIRIRLTGTCLEFIQKDNVPELQGNKPWSQVRGALLNTWRWGKVAAS